MQSHQQLEAPPNKTHNSQEANCTYQEEPRSRRWICFASCSGENGRSAAR